MKLPVHDIRGKELRTLDVDETVFGITPNVAVLHQAFVAQRNNQRWGTAQTRTRGEVQGSTRKIRKQKYTGSARAGSNRSPTRVGGGVAFGPRMRDYSQAMPKKMRRLAIRSALSGKVADGQLVVIDQFALETPRTKEIVRVLRNVGIERSALIVTGEPDQAVKASARNLGALKVLPAAYLNVVDMMNHKSMLMTEDAVRVAEQLWGKDRATAAPKAPAAKAAAAKTPAAKTPAAKTPARARKAAPEPAPVAEAEAPAATVETPKAAPARARVKAAAAKKPAPAKAKVAPAKKPAPAKAKAAAAKKPALAKAKVAPAKKPAPAKAKVAPAKKPTPVKAKAAPARAEAAAEKPKRAAAKPKAQAKAQAAPKAAPKRRAAKKTDEGEA
jgi:large subunit ribosomal protein L4